MKLGDCPECVDFLGHLSPVQEATLIEACASVGISRGKSTRQMLASFMSRYHQGGHVDELSERRGGEQ